MGSQLGRLTTLMILIGGLVIWGVDCREVILLHVHLFGHQRLLTLVVLVYKVLMCVLHFWSTLVLYLNCLVALGVLKRLVVRSFLDFLLNFLFRLL